MILNAVLKKIGDDEKQALTKLRKAKFIAEKLHINYLLAEVNLHLDKLDMFKYFTGIKNPF